MIRSFFNSVVLTVVLATGVQNIPTTTAQTIPSKPVTTQSTSLAAIEQAIHLQVNQYRASRGLPPLSLDARISQQARTHSQNMANRAVAFGHDGFNQRVQALAQVVPYTGAAENVAYNQGYRDPATVTVQGWLKSTGHRTNIEGQYNLTGIGIAKNAKGEYYFTQIFIRSR